MEQEINVQDIENQKPMELATGQGISRFQNVLRDDAVLANENLQKVVEKSQGVEGNIEKLLSDISQEGAFRSSVEGMAGVPQAQQRLNELARLSSVETRQLQKDILGNELQAMGTMETRGFLDARDARANRESAIRSLTIASEAELLQGNLEQARALVDKAVSAKFEPMKQELEIRKFNLDRLDKTQLEPAQKAQAEATKRKLDSQMKEVETQEQLLRTITTNQAPADIRDKAMKAENLEELYAIPGIEKYFMSPKDKLELQKIGMDIKLAGAQYSKVIQELNDARQVIGGTTGDPTLDIITASSKYGDKRLTDSQLEKIQKATEALGSLESLQGMIGINPTGPLKGRARTLLSQLGGDADAGAINATIQGLIPTVARGIFGEVGVLTNEDINNYKKTLPNINSTDEQNKLVSLIMYDVLSRSVKSTLISNAQNQANVSNFASTYLDVEKRIGDLKNELGVVEVAPIAQENRVKMESAWQSNTTETKPMITDKLNSLLGF
jgi:hypothetical protein